MQYNDLKMYLSYSWAQTKEATLLEKTLFEEWGIILTRDRKEIGYKDSIDDFMNELAEQKHIILLLSDNYFKSENCMYEFVSIFGNKNFRDRILPIKVDGSQFKIYSSDDRMAQLEYWKSKLDALEKYNQQCSKDFKKIENIFIGLSDALFELSNLSISSFSELDDSRFQMLVDNITKNYNEEFERPKFKIFVKPFEALHLFQPDKISFLKSLPTKTPIPFHLSVKGNEDILLRWIDSEGKISEKDGTNTIKERRNMDDYFFEKESPPVGFTYPSHAFALYSNEVPILAFRVALKESLLFEIEVIINQPNNYPVPTAS